MFPKTTYCSKECYRKELKNYLWNYKFRIFKKELRDFSKLFFRIYFPKVVEFLISMFILSLIFMTFDMLIWAVEMFIN